MEPGGFKTIEKHWFGSLETPKPIKNNGLGAWRPQNLGSLEAPKPYENNGLGAWGHKNHAKTMACEPGSAKNLIGGVWGAQNLTKTLAWELGDAKTMRKQWFGPAGPKPCKNKGLGALRLQNFAKAIDFQA